MAAKKATKKGRSSKKPRASKRAAAAAPRARKKRTAGAASKKRTAKKRTAKAASKTRAAGKSEALLTQLRQFIRTRGGEYLEDTNITSVGVALKDGEHVLQFTVEQKVQPEAIERLGSREIPKEITVGNTKVPTDVVQRSFQVRFIEIEAPQKDARKTRVDPVVPGISVSHPDGTAGTLGAIVFDRNDGTACMLSNWHVLHGPTGELGDVVVQPGPFDDNRVEKNQAGFLVRSHLGAAGDCAIARIDGRSSDPTVFGLATAVRRLARPELGDLVVKSGRTTGITAGKVRRIDVLAKVSYPGVGVQQVGGFEIGPPDGIDAETYEVSMGGDSGSVWLAATGTGKRPRATDVMVGLHFAGESDGDSDEHALACYAESVFEKLEITLDAPSIDEVAQAAPVGAGFNRNFLTTQVPIPKLSPTKKADAVRFESGTLIPYTHFSVCLSKSRRFAFFVAWNVNGRSLKAFGRKSLKFKLDPRIDEDFQVGDDLYSDNRLDRGHLARRADLVWGPDAEAQQANKDSFFFTNIAPQHEAFNRSNLHGLWGELENAILEDVDVENLRLSAMAGPLFKQNDPVHRGIKIPRSYWKLIAFVDTADDAFKVKAYVLTQDDLLDQIEALELDPFRMFQVSVAELQKLTGLDFGSLEKADAFAESAAPESLSARRGVREVFRRQDI